jgi:hypothetical protein
LCTFARELSVADPDNVVNLGAKAMKARAKALSARARSPVPIDRAEVLVAGVTAMFAANHASRRCC